MFSTEEIADTLKLTSRLMELHDENPFKVKSLANAAFKLSKINIDLQNKSLAELEQIEGIGKGIASKINELQTTGKLKELEQMISKTPEGVIEMMSIKGLGPKKVANLWHQLEVESIGELLYACNENRLLTLKGFGEKTQAEVKAQIEFHQANIGKHHYAAVEKYALDLVKFIKEKYQTDLVSLTGQMRRKCEIIDKIEILVASENEIDITSPAKKMNVKTEVITCSKDDFYNILFETTATPEHILQVQNSTSNIQRTAALFHSEKEIYEAHHLQYIEPELREGLNEVMLAKENKIPKLIELSDLRGILHNHTTYSDGINTLKEMADYCKQLGYEYLGICDHSKSAFYANGLKEDRVLEQQQEIDELNKKMAPFKILKGIESDILHNGSLDYDNETLKTFDFVVASVHSGLKMNEEKATERLIKAIENPYTTILGHPSGRLLLSREAYPLDYKKIIDACAANEVVIELNAHPYRLDIDWRWIPYCLEKGVMISINPDAHIKEGYHDMYYGVCAARKGMLTKEMCFNALSLEKILEKIKN
jgi:DNA polymerase (family 10)